MTEEEFRVALYLLGFGWTTYTALSIKWAMYKSPCMVYANKDGSSQLYIKGHKCKQVSSYETCIEYLTKEDRND